MITAVFQILYVLLDILWWIIVIQAVMSVLIAFNVINTYHEAVRAVWTALTRITDPIYRPIRRILPDLGPLDFSPFVVLVLLFILSNIVLPAIYNAMVGGGAP